MLILVIFVLILQKIILKGYTKGFIRTHEWTNTQIIFTIYNILLFLTHYSLLIDYFLSSLSLK